MPDSALPAPPLINANALAARLGQPDCVIVDARKGDGYARAHIPGARKLAIDPHLHHPGRVIEPEAFGAEMARLGIGPETMVVTYDDTNNLFGARLWWVLRHYGHSHVRVLDGGWDGWAADGMPVVADTTSPVPPGAFTPRLIPGLLAETADLRAAMEDPACQILDVRGNAEWQRRAPTEMSMAGHVPGALHLVWTDTIDPVTHRFRPADDLRAHFTALGLRRDAEIIVYCQGGIRAAHSLLALRLAGYERARNYEGSWAQWSREQMPAEIEPAATPMLHD